MRSYIFFLNILVFWLAPIITCAQNSTDTSPLKENLNELLEWFPDEYDNHQQVYQEAISKLPEEKKHRQTHHIFYPVQLHFIEGKTLYAQQSQHYDLDNIYRQRIYAFSIDEKEQAIRLTIYTPKKPNRFKNAHLNPAFFQTLSKDDFIL